MSPYWHAIIASLSRSSNDILYRKGMLSHVDPWVLAIFNSFLGGLLILCFTGFPSFSGLGHVNLILLLMANLFWSGATLLYFQTLRDLDVALNALLDCLRYVLLMLAGWALFGERVGAFDLAGVFFIIGSILLGLNLNNVRYRRGAIYSMSAVLCGTGALAIEKQLTSAIDTDLVILSGFFLPGIFYCMARPATVLQIGPAFRRNGPFLVLTSVLIACTGANLIYALGKGQLGLSMTIYQSSVVITFVLGALLLGEREDLYRRCVSSILCLTGIALISAF
jgi:drug/metabolite transporter (DMT)-like permease